MRLAVFVLTVVALAAWAGAAHAQREGAVEIGLDGGIAVSIFDEPESILSADIDQLTLVRFPEQRFRLGVFVTDELEVEPSVAFTLLSQGDSKLFALDLGFALAYNARLSGSTNRPFVQGGLLLSAVGNGTSDIQFGVGGSVGLKIPSENRVAMRLEVGGSRLFESSEFVGVWTLFGSIGVSFFTQ